MHEFQDADELELGGAGALVGQAQGQREAPGPTQPEGLGGLGWNVEGGASATAEPKRPHGIDLSDADGTEALRFVQEEQDDDGVEQEAEHEDDEQSEHQDSAGFGAEVEAFEEAGEGLLDGLEGGGMEVDALAMHTAANATDELTVSRGGAVRGTLDDTAADHDAHASAAPGRSPMGRLDDDGILEDDEDIEFGSNDELSF